jgi:hypothetical protein
MFVLVYILRHFIVPQVIMYILSLPGVETTNVVNVDIFEDLITGFIAVFARIFFKGIMEYITETLEPEKLPMTCSMMSGQGPDGGEDSDSGTRNTEEKGKGTARPEDSSGSDSGTRNTAEKKGQGARPEDSAGSGSGSGSGGGLAISREISEDQLRAASDEELVEALRLTRAMGRIMAEDYHRDEHAAEITDEMAEKYRAIQEELRRRREGK